MRPTIQSLGWFMRRSPDPSKLVGFYTDVLGLPIIRAPRPDVQILYAGEATSFEILSWKTDDPVLPDYTDRAQVPCTPIFRVHGIDGTIRRLRDAGVSFINDIRREHSRLAFFLDPEGHVTGIEERYRGSPRPEDAEAFRRWDAGAVGMPGVGPLPPDIQNLAWVAIRVDDVRTIVAWYRDVIGLDVTMDNGEDSALLTIGDGAQLAVLGGGVVREPPTNRDTVPDVWMIRLHDIDGVMADLKARGVHVVHDIFEMTGGRLAYVADPEGNIVGIQEHPGDGIRAEEDESGRRWAARR